MDRTLIEMNQALEAEIAQRKRAEDRFRALLESAPDAVIIVNADGDIVLVNTQAVNFFGYTHSELLGKPIEMLIPEPFHSRHPGQYTAEPHIRDMGAGSELYALRKDGSQFPVEISLSPIETEDGILIASAIRDITARKQQERILHFHASLQENVSDAVIATDLEYRIQSWNRAAENIYGWRAEEVIGRSAVDVLQTRHESEQERERIVSEFLKHGHWSGEFLQHHKNGHELYILGSTTLFKDEKGMPFGVVSVNHDITERKKAEAALRESEKQLRLLAENSPDMIYILDLAQHRATYMNRPEFLGYSQSDIEGSNSLLSAVHPDDKERLFAHWRDIIGGLRGRGLIEYRLQDKYGQWQWIKSRETTLAATPDGQPKEILVTLTIITERKQAEQQALELRKEQERVKILSDFVRNISHDFRTPLASISTGLYLLSKITDPEKRGQRLDEADGQVKRLTRLLDRLLTMVRLDSQTVVTLQPLDINRLIADFCAELVIESKAVGISVRCSLSESNLMVQADAEELQLAMAELGQNAIRFNQANGTITIRTRQQDHQAVIEVSDTGMGIPSADLPHIFDRLYRADKARSAEEGGAGLGLSIAKRIIELHHGHITVESVVGKGSTFTVFLRLIH